MPIIKGPSRPGGDPEQTRKISTQSATADSYGEKTIAIRPGPADKAIVASSGRHTSDDEKTHIVGSRSSGKAPTEGSFADDPVVGWLVVVKGPGSGQALKIGYGQNSVGRASSQRIRLDFGDDKISRESHAFVTYDPKNRKFYIQNGGGSNLIYIGSDPVLSPTELAPKAVLNIGDTTICFVPFCGADFDWQDRAEMAAK